MQVWERKRFHVRAEPETNKKRIHIFTKKKVFFLFTPAEHFHKIMISNVVYMLAIYYVQSYKQNSGDRRDNH